MSAKGKAETIRILRSEVGFGCPICRSPFLTWHHFDPPWHVEKHWRPEGIVALCPLCHADADEKGDRPGAYSTDELRALKNSARSLDEVKAQFCMWRGKENVLVRVGGCYSGAGAAIVSVNGQSQIAIGQNEEGLLSLFFQLQDAQGRLVAEMQNNWFTVIPENVSDMTVLPKTKAVKIWLSKSDIGMEFSFRRISPAELDEILKKDLDRSTSTNVGRDPKLDELMAQVRQNDAFLGGPPSRRLSPNLPDHIWKAHISDDRVGHYVKSWVTRHCANADGLIPLIDFNQMAIYFHGRRIEIRNGIADQIQYSAMFNNALGGAEFSVPVRGLFAAVTRVDGCRD